VPRVPRKRYLDWDLDDPAGKTLDAVGPIRDYIKHRVQQLITESSRRSCWQRPSSRSENQSRPGPAGSLVPGGEGPLDARC
jgi:hypothetical protein